MRIALHAPRHTGDTALAALVLLALGLPTAAGCRFDDSALDTKTACVVDEDCVLGACVNRQCVRSTGGDTDAGGGVDVCTPNACGGCAALDEAPGSTCGSCGRLVCDGLDAVRCDEGAGNACGGCGVLGATPGTPCGPCAVWSCAADGERLNCVTQSDNGCGGCGPLEATPGSPCGECGNGRWVCLGSEAIACQGDSVDVCGGCEGPFGPVSGSECGCGTPTLGDAPIWACDAGEAACADENDVAFTGYSLGAIDDTQGLISRRGSLQYAGDEDWYRVVIRDAGGLPDLTSAAPRVTMSGAGAGDLVCLFWEYSDGREWTLACGADNRVGTDEASPLRGCCSAPGTGTVSAQLGNGDHFGGDLDSIGDASGVLHIVVTSEEAAPACREYSLRIDL